MVRPQQGVGIASKQASPLFCIKIMRSSSFISRLRIATKELLLLIIIIIISSSSISIR